MCGEWILRVAYFGRQNLSAEDYEESTVGFSHGKFMVNASQCQLRVFRIQHYQMKYGIVDARQIPRACNKSSKGNYVKCANVQRNIFSRLPTTLALTSGDPENFSSRIFPNNSALLTWVCTRMTQLTSWPSLRPQGNLPVSSSFSTSGQPALPPSLGLLRLSSSWVAPCPSRTT